MMLDLRTHILGDTAIVDCAGKIIYGEEAAFLRTYINDILDEHPNIVLDLSGVTHIDSNGIGTMVGLWAAARHRGGDLKLAALSSRAHNVLSITNLTALFSTYDTAEQAAASFAAQETACTSAEK